MPEEEPGEVPDRSRVEPVRRRPRPNPDDGRDDPESNSDSLRVVRNRRNTETTDETETDTDPRAMGRPSRSTVVFAVAAALVVVLVILWASRSTGERPTFGTGAAESDETDQRDGSSASSTSDADSSGEPDSSDVASITFSSTVDPMPSAGCGAPGPQPSEELRLEGNRVGSVLYAPSDVASATDSPAPVMVIISEPDMPAGDLALASGLFEAAGGYFRVGITPDDSDPQQLGTATAGLLEDIAATQCVDLARVNVLGYGAGAQSTADVACEVPELVTGIALVAGTGEPSCQPDPAVAVLISANGDDPAVDTGMALLEVGSAWAESVGLGVDTVDGRDEDTLIREWSGPNGLTVRTVWSAVGGHEWTAATSLEVGPFLRDNARAD